MVNQLFACTCGSHEFFEIRRYTDLGNATNRSFDQNGDAINPTTIQCATGKCGKRYRYSLTAQRWELVED